MTRVELDEPPSGQVWPMPTFATFDTETTGTNTEADRFVSAYIGSVVEGVEHAGRSWLINPGIPIPHAATEVHGLGDEDVEDGVEPAAALMAIVGHLEDLANAAIPLVVYNAPFDLTMLDREWRRHIDPEGIEVFLEEELLVLDPLVLDKGLDRYRSGSRRLGDVAEHYGITVDRSALHGAEADARLAGRLMLHLWRETKILGYPASHLHERQIDHYREQQGSYADWLHSRGRHDEACAVRYTWPFHPIGES